jgi:hypothetical protein
MRAAALTLLGLLGLLASPVSESRNGERAPAFMAACNSADDPFFGRDTLLVLVYPLARDTMTLFSVRNEKQEWLADVNHFSSEDGASIESTAGMGTTAATMDAIEFLRRAPFELVDDWKVSVLKPPRIVPCKVEYQRWRSVLDGSFRNSPEDEHK